MEAALGERPTRRLGTESSYSLAVVVAVVNRTSPEEHYHWQCTDRACTSIVGIVVDKEDIAEACLIQEMERGL